LQELNLGVIAVVINDFVRIMSADRFIRAMARLHPAIGVAGTLALIGVAVLNLTDSPRGPTWFTIAALVGAVVSGYATWDLIRSRNEIPPFAADDAEGR
jgi:hypothetical protein